METTRLPQGRQHRRRVGDVLADPRRRRTRSSASRRSRATSRQLVRRAAGDRRPRRADPPAARFHRGSDLRHRSERRLHVLQLRVRAAARLRVAGRADRQADAPADSPHAAGRHAVSARSSRRSTRRCATATGAHVDDEVLWRADGTSFPAEYLEPPDPPQRRGDRRGRDVPRRHRAAAGRSRRFRKASAGASSSWRCCRTSCAIRWRRFSAPRACSTARAGPTMRCQEAGQVVERQANHMARLLDDLLDVARITRGRIVLRNERRRSARYGALRDRSARRRSWRSATRACTIDIADEPVPVFGDPARLQQIQANLLSNASKYSPRGGRGPLRAARATATRR